MKKIAVLLCSFFMLLTSFSTAHAQENVAVYDSIRIPAEEIENFAKTNEDDSIICKYYVNFLPYICGEQTGTVRERLQNELQTFSHCLISVNSEELAQDEPTTHTNVYHHFLQAILYPERMFESVNLLNDLEIHEVYAMESQYEGLGVYYVTNKGNYLYYTHFYVAEGSVANGYLLPESVVRDLYPKHIVHQRDYHGHENGMLLLFQSFDLSAYKVHGNEEIVIHRHDPSELETEDEISRRTEPFFPTAAVIAAAVSLAVLGGVTLAAWLYQKKTHR